MTTRLASALFVGLFAVVAFGATATGASGAAKSALTAITVSPIHEAQVVRGDDGKDHVEYDLLVVSVFDAPVTLSSVTVLDPTGKQLGLIDGNTLAAATQELFTHQAVPAVPASGAVAVEIDLAVTPGTVPARLTNKIVYTVPADTQSAPLLEPPRSTAPR